MIAKPTTIDVYGAIQALNLSMVERFTKLETTYGFVAERLAKLETQNELVRESLKDIQQSEARTGQTVRELEKTTSDLERDISVKTKDLEQRIRVIEKQVWQMASAAGVLAVVVTMVIERIVIPAVMP